MSNCRKGIIIMIIAGIFVFLSSFVYAQGLRLRKDMDAYDYYIQAKRLYEDGKYKQARDKFKQVLQIDPGYPWVNLYLEMIKQFLHEQDSLKTTTVEERKNFEKQIEKRKKQARKKKKRAKKKISPYPAIDQQKEIVKDVKKLEKEIVQAKEKAEIAVSSNSNNRTIESKAIEVFPIHVQGDEVEFFPEEKKVVGKRNVKIDYEDMQLTCDEITVFMQTKQAFAKGNVILDQGKMVITADEVEYDFDTRKGSIKNWSADSKKDKSIKPWYSKGSLAKGISKTKYEFINTYITSCNLPNPHYKIQAKKINVYLNDRVVAKKAVFKVGKIPVFYFPSYNYSLHTGRPQLSLIPGTNKDWGTYVLSAWTYYLNEKLKGRILLDYRSKLGFGEGIESDYKTGKFGGGKFTGYYTYEDDKDKLSSSSTKERFRIKIRHRWDITDKTYFTGECNKWSDDTFLKHYFESEFEQERRPETQFSLTHNDSQYSGNLLLNKRINHFFTNTEYLPQVKFHLKKQSLFNLPIYYGSELSAANLTRKNANSNIDNDAVRVNVFNEIWTQYKLFGISFTPRFGNQETYYSKNVFGDENRLRNAFNTGIEAKTKFFKTFNWSTDKWGLDINKLRHIVTPSIRYDYRHSPTISANNLAQFDDMDSLTRDNKVTLYLENKLQTKKNVDNGMITTELLRLIMQCNYEFKLEDGSRFTNVNADIELNPYSWMILESDVNFNTKTDHFDTYNLDFYVRKNDDFKTGIGYRYHRKENSELTGEIKKRITDKWKVRIYESFEFKTGSFYEQEYSIIRDLHCWEFVMNCNIKDSETFWFSLRLKDFPELPFKLKTGYNTPKGK